MELRVMCWGHSVAPYYPNHPKYDYEYCIETFPTPYSFEEFKLWFDIMNLKEVDTICFQILKDCIYVSRETLDTNFKEIEIINRFWKDDWVDHPYDVYKCLLTQSKKP